MAKEPEKQDESQSPRPSVLHAAPQAGAPPAGRPQSPQPARAESEPEPFGAGTPYTGPSEIVPGGLYVQKATLKGTKHYGGEVANGRGDVLATFEADQENTGKPSDGKLTDKGKEFVQAASEKGKDL